MIGYLRASYRPRQSARRPSFKPWLDLLEDRLQPSAVTIPHAPLIPIDPIPPIGGSSGVVTVSTQELDLTRGGPAESFTVVLNSAPTAEVDLTLAAYDPSAGSDGTTISIDHPHLKFDSGDWSTPQTVNVTAAAGSTPLSDASLTIVGTTSSADTNFDAQAVPPIQVYVTDPVVTPPGIVLSNDYLNVTRGGSGDSFNVALATQPTDNVTITIAQSGGDALQLSTTTLLFTPTNWNNAQTVNVGPPTSGGGNQFDTLTLTDSSNDPNYNNGDLPAVSVNVTDPAGLSISTTSLTVTAGGPSATYTIALTTQPSADVTVVINQFSPIQDPPGPMLGNAMIARPVFFGNNITLNITPQTLTFTPADWSTPQTVSVAAPDVAVRPYGNVVFLNEDVTSTDPSYSGLAAPGVSVTVQPDASIPVPNLVFSKQSLTVLPGGLGDSYTIALASQPTDTVTVTISQQSFPIMMPMVRAIGGTAVPPVFAGNTLTITPTTLTFDPTDWNVPQTVSVTMPAGTPTGSLWYWGRESLVHTVTSNDPNYNNLWTPPLPVLNDGLPPLPPLPVLKLPPVLVLPIEVGHPVPPKHTLPVTTHHPKKPPQHTTITPPKHTTGTKPPKPTPKVVVHTTPVTGWTVKTTHTATHHKPGSK